MALCMPNCQIGGIINAMNVQAERLLAQLNRVDEWVRGADVKIGVLLTFDGVVLATVAKHSLSAIFSINSPEMVIVGYLFVLVLLTWSIVKALWGILPRLKHKQNIQSLLYYYDVAQMDLTSYRHDMNHMTAAKYRDALLSQIHAVSAVAARKMVCFKDAVILLAISLFIAGGLELWLRLQILLKA